jgi:DNA helicase-2/ATP-dependent DNA helicase PcrA
LRSNNAVDFDDLLGLSVALLSKSGSDVRKFYNKKFTSVLVDEFQVRFIVAGGGGAYKRRRW